MFILKCPPLFCLIQGWPKATKAKHERSRQSGLQEGLAESPARALVHTHEARARGTAQEKARLRSGFLRVLLNICSSCTILLGQST